jgi:hypothetical protein
MGIWCGCVTTASNFLYQKGRTREGDDGEGNLLISQVLRGERTRETKREMA